MKESLICVIRCANSRKAGPSHIYHENLWDFLKLKILIIIHFTPTEWSKHLIFPEYLACTRHYSKYLTHMNLFNPHSSNFIDEKTETLRS